ncbi:MAG: 5-bromo-4-chloroindolyl phosphate hydrolysis family protein [Lachnospiraceae bacterium]|nr:5-bromo-4-chloroindolyl phosphate hydrolysis family protein [Lachnospiraceae bacterium]
MGKNALFGAGAIALILAALGILSRFAPGMFKGLLIAGVVIVVIIAALIIGLIAFALSRSKSDAKTVRDNKNAGKATVNSEQSEILAKGRENLMELRKLIVRIKDREIHKKANEVCAVIDKILQTLREKPDKIPNTRQFFNYYLPTLKEVLNKYKRIEDSGVEHTDMTRKVSNYLTDCKNAMDKQYEGLFANDILDMTVDMEAMKQAVKRDGLASEEGVAVGEGDDKISLTL